MARTRSVSANVPTGPILFRLYLGSIHRHLRSSPKLRRRVLFNFDSPPTVATITVTPLHRRSR